MKLLSVNVGQIRDVTYHGDAIQTAIWKSAVEGPVQVGPLGLAGDAQADTQAHGGLEQAVYVYDQQHYEFWSRELDRDDFEHGQFGENFTVTGMTEETVCIGDTFQIGAVKAQVSQPRAPCFKLGLRMEETAFVKSFTKSCRIGFYLRILEEGVVAAGDAIELLERVKPNMTVADVFRVRYLDPGDLEGARQAAQLPGLSIGWRDHLRQRSADRL